MVNGTCIIPDCRSQNRNKEKDTFCALFTVKLIEKRPRFIELQKRLIKFVHQHVGSSPAICRKIERGYAGVCERHFWPEHIQQGESLHHITIPNAGLHFKKGDVCSSCSS